MRNHLQNGSKLFIYNLLERLGKSPNTKFNSAGFTLEQAVKVNPRILDYLLGNDNVSPHLSPALKILYPSHSIEDLYLPKNLIGRVDAFASSKSQALFTPRNTFIIPLRGREGAGQQIVAESICHNRSWPNL